MATIKQTYLISIDTLKSSYPIDLNAEQKHIVANIQKSENFQIIPLLGRDKYNELITYVNEIKTGATRNPSYDELLTSYIEPVVAWFVVSEILYNQTFKTKNTGIEGDQNVFYAVQKAAAKYRADSEEYLQILKNYLEVNEQHVEQTFVQHSSIFLGDTSDYDKKVLGSNVSPTQYTSGWNF